MENIDPSLLLGLLANMNKTDSPAAEAPGGSNDTNDLLLKLLLSGGLQKMMTPKPKPAENPRTINLDDYVRID